VCCGKNNHLICCTLHNIAIPSHNNAVGTTRPMLSDSCRGDVDPMLTISAFAGGGTTLFPFGYRQYAMLSPASPPYPCALVDHLRSVDHKLGPRTDRLGSGNLFPTWD